MLPASTLRVVQTVIMLGLGSLAGCSTLSITKQPATDTSTLPGLPFYVKTLRTVQVTTYQQTTYEVVVTFAPAGTESPAPRLHTEVSETGFDSAFSALLESISKIETGLKVEDAEARLNEAAKQFQKSTKPASPALPQQASELHLLGNQLTQQSVVDPTRYYINSRAPILGSASADFTLAEDGTLTNAKGSREDKTFDSVVGLLPIKELLSKSLSLDPSSKPAPSAQVMLQSYGASSEKVRALLGTKQPIPFEIRVELTPHAWSHELRKVVDSSVTSPGAPIDPTCAPAGTCEYLRKAVEAGTAAAKHAKKSPKPENN